MLDVTPGEGTGVMGEVTGTSSSRGKCVTLGESDPSRSRGIFSIVSAEVEPQLEK